MNNPLNLTIPEGLPFIDFEREFDFPVADVLGAHKDPALITQWLRPRGMKENRTWPERKARISLRRVPGMVAA